MSHFSQDMPGKAGTRGESGYKVVFNTGQKIETKGIVSSDIIFLNN